MIPVVYGCVNELKICLMVLFCLAKYCLNSLMPMKTITKQFTLLRSKKSPVDKSMSPLSPLCPFFCAQMGLMGRIGRMNMPACLVRLEIILLRKIGMYIKRVR